MRIEVTCYSRAGHSDKHTYQILEPLTTYENESAIWHSPTILSWSMPASPVVLCDMSDKTRCAWPLGKRDRIWRVGRRHLSTGIKREMMPRRAQKHYQGRERTSSWTATSRKSPLTKVAPGTGTRSSRSQQTTVPQPFLSSKGGVPGFKTSGFHGV